MKDVMTHRERILAAIDHKPVDRLPTDYWGVPEITQKLQSYFGVSDMIGLSKALDIDKIMTVTPLLKPGRANMWNLTYKTVTLPGGGTYEEPAAFPLADCESIDEIEASYEWPTVDMYDYSVIKEQCDLYEKEGFAIEGGYISLTYFYENIRGTEQMLVDMAAEPEIADYILMKMDEFASEHTRRIIEASDGRVDVSEVTDDFGTQSGLIMSPAMIERYLGKYFTKNIALVKSYGVRLFHHDDGAVASLIPWLLDKGIEVLNPIQWHLPGWDLREIKQKYGKKLCFHGGIDNQDVLPFRCAADVRREVAVCAETLFSDKTGYILAPCHNIQSITPIENVLAMYDEAKKYKG